MISHTVKFIERYNGFKEHTGIILYTPDEVSAEEVREAIERVRDNNRYTPIRDILDKIVHDHDEWSWENIKYDIDIRMPAEITNYNRVDFPCVS